MVGAIQRSTLSEQVAKAIKEFITEGQLSPGDRLPSEPEFCQRFQVSRVVIREALKSLSAAGFVGIRHGKGVFIEAFNGKSIAEQLAFGLTEDTSLLKHMIEVRLIVECGAMDLAAIRGTEDDWRALREVLAQMRREAESGLSTAESDLRFHKVLLEAAKNEPLRRLGDVLVEFFRLVVATFPPMSELYTPEEQVREHEAILEAIMAGNASEAKRLFREALFRYLTLPARDATESAGQQK